MKKLLQLAPIFLVLLLSACTPRPPTPHACTEIGCTNELKIVIDGALPATYTIELAAPGLETVSLTCVNGQSSEASIHECRPDGAVFRGLTPDEVTVTFTSDAAIVSDNLRPTYTTIQPNGPDCPPTCRQGTAKLSLP